MISFKINKKKISNNSQTYFIADIAANHDGSLTRAKKLIKLCALAGADAAKFQHFKAETIVSDFGFKKIKKLAHQKKWKKSVFEIYKAASINFKWTKILAKECKKYKIDFMTSPYDLNYVDQVDKFISAYKIGSGDITWHEIIKKISKKNKPLIIATGASDLNEVRSAFNIINKYNKKIVIMQCNTNYTAEDGNYNFINLNVLKTYYKLFGKKALLGLSDHTYGSQTVLGAVALGARMVEKHFTDDNSRNGPDHKFSMNPKTWKEMVDNTRILEKAMGGKTKKIEDNEKESSIVQRRSIRASVDIKKGEKITKKMLCFLRPCPKNALNPYEEKKILNKISKKKIIKGECITWKSIM
tara:strand:- start:4706 stop:5773 length:1068 start_codon:yes stop_codon:yes gene_type:complete